LIPAGPSARQLASGLNEAARVEEQEESADEERVALDEADGCLADVVPGAVTEARRRGVGGGGLCPGLGERRWASAVGSTTAKPGEGCWQEVQARGSIACMQYTLRNVPPELDRMLKARARQLGKSVNQVAVEALARSMGQPVRVRSLRGMPGGWSKKEAAEFDRFLAEHRRIDEELWK